MPIWHQSPKLTPRYFLETPRLFGYPFLTLYLPISFIETIEKLKDSNTLIKACAVSKLVIQEILFSADTRRR